MNFLAVYTPMMEGMPNKAAVLKSTSRLTIDRTAPIRLDMPTTNIE
jgi:hypothetical protein